MLDGRDPQACVGALERLLIDSMMEADDPKALA
jgi:hypothetical protein